MNASHNPPASPHRGWLIWAFLNDLAQRLLTWNKREQRDNLRRVFRQLDPAPGARLLDYGCGTGLFAHALAENGFGYVGYDIDEDFVHYGARLNPSLPFTARKSDVSGRGPYDFVLANCCFHHIADDELACELAFIRENLAPGGRFVLVDLIAPEQANSRLWHLYGLFEQGQFVRTRADHLRLLESCFDVASVESVRAHLFSSPRSRLFTNLEVYVAHPRRPQPDRESLA